MTMRIGNGQLSSGITQDVIIQYDGTYKVISVMLWAPSDIYNGQTLYCDIEHKQTLGQTLQTVAKQLTVYG